MATASNIQYQELRKLAIENNLGNTFRQLIGERAHFRDKVALAVLESWVINNGDSVSEGLIRQCFAIADMFMKVREE